MNRELPDVQVGFVRGSTLIETAHPGQVTIYMSCFMTGDPDKDLISHHQQEEFGKGLKETPHVRPLPRIPLTSIHLG